MEKLWMVTWQSHAPDDGQGVDVHLFRNEADAVAKYDSLVAECGVDPETGYDDEDDVDVEVHLNEVEVH